MPSPTAPTLQLLAIDSYENMSSLERLIYKNVGCVRFPIRCRKHLVPLTTPSTHLYSSEDEWFVEFLYLYDVDSEHRIVTCLSNDRLLSTKIQFLFKENKSCPKGHKISQDYLDAKILTDILKYIYNSFFGIYKLHWNWKFCSNINLIICFAIKNNFPNTLYVSVTFIPGFVILNGLLARDLTQNRYVVVVGELLYLSKCYCWCCHIKDKAVAIFCRSSNTYRTCSQCLLITETH